MVSVERIRQFSALPSEAPLHIQDTKPPAEWPQVGTVVFRNLQVSMRLRTLSAYKLWLRSVIT